MAPPGSPAHGPGNAGHHMHGGGLVGGPGRAGFPVQPGFVPPVLFPHALGNNVQLQAFPPVATPGIGNINQPGLPPGTPPVMPNINNPGGPMYGDFFGRPGSGQFHKPGFTGGGRHRGGAFGGTVIVPYPYYVPYAAPYYYYYQGPAPEAQGAPAEPQPAPSNGPGTPDLYYTPPATTGQAEQPWPAPAPSQTTPAAPAKQVTLLAFKDHTLVAVTDYWLKGDTLYYLRNGIETGVPLDQLDLPLTQQLNFERRVPFVLESRP
ncbi:MAG: hypothetical protein HYX72_04490 [Acidobacteria bacterium]|nr:hypothetical protein [Acidobacteriota bacterium]